MGGVEEFARFCRPGAELGRNAALEDGQFELEVSGVEETTPVRALGILLRCRIVAMRVV